MSAALGSLLLAFGASGATAQSASLMVPAVQTTATLPAPAAGVGPSVTVTLPPAAAAPAAATMSLAQLVAAYSVEAPLTDELNCLATAVYFEAKGESLEGQLAVAEVVQNRARSGRYPTTLCAVVKQKAQFSFVRAGGVFPRIDPGCAYWDKAKAIARIAASKLAKTELGDDVLWYHADYVAPSWGRRLSRVEKIGAHIFYRA
jgi:N-acetylmuramoyl-L-alanine amidase